MAEVVVGAPFPGVVRALEDVPDPVFAERVVGPGVAIEPGDGELTAPLAGRVTAAHPHAVVVTAPVGSVLVHLGIDTVGMTGFTLRVPVGRDVVAGEPLVHWDPVAVAAAGRSPLCPVIALQAALEAVVVLAAPGATVRRGEPILRLRAPGPELPAARWATD